MISLNTQKPSIRFSGVVSNYMLLNQIETAQKNQTKQQQEAMQPYQQPQSDIFVPVFQISQAPPLQPMKQVTKPQIRFGFEPTTLTAFITSHKIISSVLGGAGDEIVKQGLNAMLNDMEHANVGLDSSAKFRSAKEKIKHAEAMRDNEVRKEFMRDAEKLFVEAASEVNQNYKKAEYYKYATLAAKLSGRNNVTVVDYANLGLKYSEESHAEIVRLEDVIIKKRPEFFTDSLTGLITSVLPGRIGEGIRNADRKLFGNLTDAEERAINGVIDHYRFDGPEIPLKQLKFQAENAHLFNPNAPKPDILGLKHDIAHRDLYDIIRLADCYKKSLKQNAAEHDHRIKKYFDTGLINPNYVDSNGNTLFHAVGEPRDGSGPKYLQMLKELPGFNLEIFKVKDWRGRTPYAHAKALQHESVVKEFEKLGITE